MKNLSQKYITSLETIQCLQSQLAEAQQFVNALQSELESVRAKNIRLQARVWAIKLVSIILIISVLIWKIA